MRKLEILVLVFIYIAFGFFAFCTAICENSIGRLLFLASTLITYRELLNLQNKIMNGK